MVSIKAGKKTIIKKLVGDGVLISTPAGSTAYNLSVDGPILSLNSGKLAITPISPFRPRRWKGRIISNNLTIKIKNLYPKKRPIAAVADNVEIRNINNLKIRVKKNINITLLHDPKKTLEKESKEKIKKKIMRFEKFFQNKIFLNVIIFFVLFFITDIFYSNFINKSKIKSNCILQEGGFYFLEKDCSFQQKYIRNTAQYSVFVSEFGLRFSGKKFDINKKYILFWRFFYLRFRT